MNMEVREHQGVRYAFVTAQEMLITDTQSALDLIVSVQYETGCERIALPKETVTEDFFRLGTGLAGDVLQKFVNYQVKLAIIGDFSVYQSKPLRDFIYESNRGRHVFFVATEAEAAEKLCQS